MPPPPSLASGSSTIGPSASRPAPVSSDVASNLAFYRQLPPFYALQSHEPTRQRQLALWADVLAALATVATEECAGALSSANENGNDDDDDDPLTAYAVGAFKLFADSAVFRNAAIQRQLPPEGVLEVLAASAEPAEGCARRVLPLVGGGRTAVLVLAVDLESFLVDVGRYAQGHAVRQQGADGAASSVHTLGELAEEPDLRLDGRYSKYAWPAADRALDRRLASSVPALRALAEFMEVARHTAAAQRATVAEVWAAIAGDHWCCRALKATTLRNPASGELQGLKIAG
jgi:hypothetical protein